jgi:hypothetical protein
MPQRARSSPTDHVFAALSNPTRRDVLDLLLAGPLPVQDIAARFDMARRVLVVEPERLLSYSWPDGGEYAGDLDSTVTWTLRPEGHGTRVIRRAPRIPPGRSRPPSRPSPYGRRLAHLCRRPPRRPP